MAQDKTKWTHPSKPGQDQSCSFTQVKYPEDLVEKIRPQVQTTAASRGENHFAKIPTAR